MTIVGHGQLRKICSEMYVLPLLLVISTFRQLAYNTLPVLPILSEGKKAAVKSLKSPLHRSLTLYELIYLPKLYIIMKWCFWIMKCIMSYQ